MTAMTDQPLLPFIDADSEARVLLETWSAAGVVELIGRYEFLIEELQRAQTEGMHQVAPLLEHVRKVHALLQKGCKAGERI